MLQKISNFVTIIIYDSPKPPKEYKVNKGVLKLLLITLPILIVLSVLISTGFSLYLKNRIESVRSEEPIVIQNLRAQIDELNKDVKKANTNTEELVKKIAKGSPNEINSALSLFAIPSGFTDSRSLNEAKIENFSIVKKSDTLQLRFDILNNLSSSKKLSGFIHIIQYSKNAMHLYPNNEFSPENNTIQYSQGESFNVARFRPVIADFPAPKGFSVWYKVYIFSITGELISYHVTDVLEVK